MVAPLRRATYDDDVVAGDGLATLASDRAAAPDQNPYTVSGPVLTIAKLGSPDPSVTVTAPTAGTISTDTFFNQGEAIFTAPRSRASPGRCRSTGRRTYVSRSGDTLATVV